MLNQSITYRLKGFTIIEVMITLVLTSLSVSMSYVTLTQVQKLFAGYKEQNRFLQEYTRFKGYMDYESVKALLITEESENKFRIQRDSSIVFLEIGDKVILMTKSAVCDTFHFAAKDITKEYEPMSNPLWANKLVTLLQFETAFTKQKFNFRFRKQYESGVKLALNKTE